MSVASPVTNWSRPRIRRVAERVHRAVAAEQPVAVVRPRRGERDDRRRDRPAAERTEEAGVAEREHPAVFRDHPVAAARAGRDDADHRAGEVAPPIDRRRQRRRTRRRRRRRRRTSSRGRGRRRHAQRGPVEPHPAGRAVERGVPEGEHAAVAGQEPVAGRGRGRRRCRRWGGSAGCCRSIRSRRPRRPRARSRGGAGRLPPAATDNPTASVASTTRRAAAPGGCRRRHVRTALAEAVEPEPHEHDGEADQRGVDREQRHVRDVGQRGPEALAHVHERVDQHSPLQPGDRPERRPRVVDAPRNVIGITRMPNSSGTCRGSTRVPIMSPSAPASTHGEREEREQHRPVDVEVHGRAGTSGAIGNTIAAANAAWSAPDTIFCIADRPHRAAARAPGPRSPACSRTPAPAAAPPPGCPGR